MLITLIRRELLDNLMTFRFAAATFIMVLLVVANAFVLLMDYERRLASHNEAVKMHHRQLEEKITYSAGEVRIDRPPNPLSIFNVGFDKRLGNEVGVSHGVVPSLWDASMHGSSNPFMAMFASIDIVFIFEVILSLLALVFAYDAFAGEYERGTLRLVLTHPIRRGKILVAKYVSAMLCLIVPVVISVLLAMLLLTTSTALSLDRHDFLRIGGIIATSVAYLSVFYLIGLLISAATRRTSTALMVAMFVWGFLVLIYPNVILTVVPRPEAPDALRTSAFNRLEGIWDTFDRERKRYLATDDFPGEDWGYELRGWGSRGAYFIQNPRTLLYTYESHMDFSGFGEEDEPKMPHAQKHFGFLGAQTVAAADRTWLIRKPTLEEIFIHPANTERLWLKLSPIGLYDAATQAWAGTDLLGVRDFFDAARHYRQSVVHYFHDTKAFESRQWFSGDKAPADWSGLPQFSFQRADINTNAKRAVPDLFLLLTINCVLFAIIFLIFIKSEI